VLTAVVSVTSGMVTQHWVVAEWVAGVLFVASVIALIWVSGSGSGGTGAPPAPGRVAGRPDYASGTSRGGALPAARQGPAARPGEDGHAGSG
jgi:hypothetical protein